MQPTLFEREVSQIEVIRPLRPRQLKAYADARAAIAEGHKHFGLQAHTGWGKTLWAAHVIAAALKRGKRPLFTCPAISLVDQTLAAFEAEGIHDIGVMQAQHARTDRNATVQIASVQTLLRRAPIDVDLVLIDEFHEQFDGLNALLEGAWKDVVVIGLSATPWARGMGLRWSKLIIGGTIQDAIADGYARPFTIYGPPHDIDREALSVEKGEFTEASASAAMTDSTIVGDVLTEWKERSSREKTFAFCVNRDHAKAQMEAFHDCGIPFGYIDAMVPQDERRRIFDQMAYGEIAGIASVGCLIRGVDEVVYNILDLQPTMSEMRHVQKWGRMRTGDPTATYTGFDHAGNNAKLGLFSDIFHDTLDTRKPGERAEAFKEDYKPAKPRKCQKCQTMVRPGARACPTCAEKMPLYPGVTVKDGRLVEIKATPPLTREQSDWLRQLKMIRDTSGYKNGWLRHAFEEKFGFIPETLPTRGMAPTPEVKQFVREKRKAYLAEKKASEAVTA